jgi:hypothetical protein
LHSSCQYHLPVNEFKRQKIIQRAVCRKLKDVQELPAGEVTALLPQTLMEDDVEVSEANREEGD